MKQQLKNFVKSASRAVQSDALALQGAINKELQILLSMQYRAAAAAGRPIPFSDIGINLYSETDEDGILLYIFSVIGMRSRVVVDIGAAGIHGSNTANLLTNHGFNGLLLDGNGDGIEIIREYYATHNDTKYQPPVCKQAMITRDNVNEIITSNGISGEIDLLCIDIDGNDYWIWDAINAVTPSVVLIEYQDILGPDRSWVIPYKPDFDFSAYDVNREHRNYVGASLRAMSKLAAKKGYRLVGTNRGGWNAFFVRNGLGDGVLPAVPVESCFGSAWNRFGMEKRFPLVKDLEWVEV
ncbi:MAG TPA: hypothetical protein VND45_04395 [Thermoanaerobaculia bacterium]|nr:hypothetical protein [Thermoanaerobaculia bacterium]